MRIKELHQILQQKKNGKVTQNDIARAIGTSRANVSKLFSKNSFLNDDKLKMIEDYFGIKLDEKNGFAALDYYPDSVAVIKNNEIVMSEKRVKFKIPSAFLGINDSKDYFICHSNDNSMYPLIIEGDFLVIEKTEKIENNKIYLFLYGKDIYIRRLRKNIKEIIAKAENKEYRNQNIQINEMENFYPLGKIVNIIRGENSLY